MHYSMYLSCPEHLQVVARSKEEAKKTLGEGVIWVFGFSETLCPECRTELRLAAEPNPNDKGVSREEWRRRNPHARIDPFTMQPYNP